MKEMELTNATIDASQVASFILDHRHSLRDFNFQEINLRTGNWDKALAPLTKPSGSDRWKEPQKQESTVDVLIVLSLVGIN